MSIPKKAYEARPVQVQWLQTSVLVEYVPANIERPRAKKAYERAMKAKDSDDLELMHTASIDWLAELLTGWSHRDRKGNPIKPTREALARQPSQWIGAALTAISSDMAIAAQEFEREERGDKL